MPCRPLMASMFYGTRIRTFSSSAVTGCGKNSSGTYGQTMSRVSNTSNGIRPIVVARQKRKSSIGLRAIDRRLLTDEIERTDKQPWTRQKSEQWRRSHESKRRHASSGRNERGSSQQHFTQRVARLAEAVLGQRREREGRGDSRRHGSPCGEEVGSRRFAVW